MEAAKLFQSIVLAGIVLGLSPSVRAQTPQVASGHLNENGNGYNYCDNNCHSFANRGVLSDMDGTGIFRCFGNRGDQGGHTINYQVDYGDGETIVTFYNYGGSCRATLPGGLTPGYFDQNDEEFAECLKKFCGADWNGSGQGFLAVGQLDEIPGQASCVTKVSRANGNNFSVNGEWKACNACCQERAKTIDGWENSNSNNGYLTKCLNSCGSFFKQ